MRTVRLQLAALLLCLAWALPLIVPSALLVCPGAHAAAVKAGGGSKISAVPNAPVACLMPCCRHGGKMKCCLTVSAGQTPAGRTSAGQAFGCTCGMSSAPKAVAAGAPRHPILPVPGVQVPLLIFHFHTLTAPAESAVFQPASPEAPPPRFLRLRLV